MARKRKYENQIIGEYKNKYFGIIYKITNKINGKIYIGQTRSDLNVRFSKHVLDSRTEKRPLSKAIKKYGWENFTIEIIDNTDNIQELNEKEIYYIKEFNSIVPGGYNFQTGGQIGFNSFVTDDTKMKTKNTLIKKRKSIGIYKRDLGNNYKVALMINDRLYLLGGIKEFDTAREIYNSMSLYYLGNDAVLNEVKENDLEPLSINDCKKYVKYLNYKILYNCVTRIPRDGRYGLNMKVNKKEVFAGTFLTQIDAAYVADYFIRKYNLNNDNLNFPNISLNKDDIIEIIKRNDLRKGGKISDYSKL